MPIQMTNHSYLSGVLFRKIITDNVNYLNRLHQHLKQITPTSYHPKVKISENCIFA